MALKHAAPPPLASDEIEIAAKRARFSIDGLLAKQNSTPSCSTPSPVSKQQPEVDTESDDSDGGAPSAPIGNWPPLGAHPNMDAVECRLEGRELWAKFYDLSTEMIITKSGRRMFPTVKVRLESCDPEGLFYVFLDVVPVDDRRYRYVYNKSSWLTAGKAEPSPEPRLYMHPDSPFPGRQLASQVISFEKAKLTNSDVERTGHLVLNSMHKYQPRVHVVRRDRNQPISASSKVDLKKEVYKSFQFSETQFMAVTAYQNQLITKLKIEKNPFAKGFRDPSGRSTEMDLERHLERLPRFPFNGCLPAAAAAALMFGGQLPFPGLPMPPPPFPGPQPPNGGPSADWLFANLAAMAALNPLNAGGNGFPKFSLPQLPTSNPNPVNQGSSPKYDSPTKPHEATTCKSDENRANNNNEAASEINVDVVDD
uniref:T-box domain-containing protein n=1 Tax=Panagrellus redivivus TaxID=6233 RepID=A0A7E4VZM7_PANRE